MDLALVWRCENSAWVLGVGNRRTLRRSLEIVGWRTSSSPSPRPSPLGRGRFGGGFLKKGCGKQNFAPVKAKFGRCRFEDVLFPLTPSFVRSTSEGRPTLSSRGGEGEESRAM